MQFLTVYIREAHPVDGWWFGQGFARHFIKRFAPRVAMDIYDPKTIEERRSAAGRCEESLKVGIRTYVDKMDDPVSKAYAARPTRLYLVGTDGRVFYAGGPGPWGFKPPELKAAIKAYLANLL
jgi:type I thyroxine 5'-deiodinase